MARCKLLFLGEGMGHFGKDVLVRVSDISEKGKRGKVREEGGEERDAQHCAQGRFLGPPHGRVIFLWAWSLWL